MIGFKNYGEEYKVMGLSSYGEPIYKDIMLDNLFHKNELFKLNLKYFNHNKKTTRIILKDPLIKNNCLITL